MNHFLRKVFFIHLFVFVSVFSFAQYNGGSGTQADPYQISTVQNLLDFSESVCAGNSYENVYFQLQNDIDLSVLERKNEKFSPIGIYNNWNDMKPFRGIFDGQGFVIKNLNLELPNQNHVALFGVVAGGVVRNLRVENAKVEGHHYVGILVGNVMQNGRIENCEVSGSVVGTRTVGGVAGLVYQGGQIFESYNFAKVYGHRDVGGIAGMVDEESRIVHSVNGGKILGTKFFVGGIAGLVKYKSIIEECINYGDIQSTAGSVGGVSGCAESKSNINTSLNTGLVVSSGNNVGGICGYVSLSDVEHCFNAGVVQSEGQCVGGIVGYSGDFSSLLYSVNCADVKGKEYQGAILGFSGNTRVYVCASDTQMCLLDNGIGKGMSDGDSILYFSTKDLLNEGLKSYLGTAYWTYNLNSYPMISSLQESLIAQSAMFPLQLSLLENVANVEKQFSTKLLHQDLSTDSRLTAIYANEDLTVLLAKGQDTLFLKRENVVYRKIPLKIKTGQSRFFLNKTIELDGNEKALAVVTENLPKGIFSVANDSILKVDDMGIISPIKQGKTFVYYSLSSGLKDSMEVEVLSSYVDEKSFVAEQKKEQESIFEKNKRELDVVNQLPFVVQFAFKSSRLRMDKTLDYLFGYYVNLLNQHLDWELEIVGHTCIMGERLYNEMLGQWRAESVKKEFIKRGIAEDRLVVFSKASDMPVLNNETKSERTKNRRVTIFVRERKNESL